MLKFKATLSALAITAAFATTQALAQTKPLNVTVTNTPLPVSLGGTTAIRDVDNPARQAVVTTDTCNMAAALVCENSFSVPANKMLVIETVSVRSVGTPGARLLAHVSLGSAPANFAIPTVFAGNFGASDIDHGTLSARLYAAPGSTVRLIGTLTNVGTGAFVASISGYLVDCGTGAGCPAP